MRYGAPVASDAVTKTWYRIAVAKPGQPAVLVAAQGEHLGIAIADAEHHVGNGARALAVEVAPGTEVPLGESVGKHHVVELGGSGEVAGLAWPPGVIPQIGHTHALAAARAGWMQHADPRRFIVEAQCADDELVDVFLGMIERLPSADNLEVRVLDHFEARAQTDVWLTSRINAHKIVSFLDDHDDELLGNGHVQLSIYIRKHKATLRLTEHKTVVWIADDHGFEAEVARWMSELKLSRTGKLQRVVDVPHFHFRGPKSKDRNRLGEELYRQRLRRVDTVRTAETAG